MRFIQFVITWFFIVPIFGQLEKAVDFQRVEVKIAPLLSNQSIMGWGSYEFEVYRKTDSIFLDAVAMKFQSVNLNGRAINYRNSGRSIGFKAPKKPGTYKLKLSYIAEPKQTVYFIGFDDDLENNEQVWTQGQGKYTSHWLPSFDDMTEKAEFDLLFIVNSDLEVIANGKLSAKQIMNDPHGFPAPGMAKERVPKSRWRFKMNNPMSSYLAAFVIGDFDKQLTHSASGVPIELYYESKDSLKAEPTYRYTTEIFDFLEEEIGVPYPWQNYKQVPVRDFLYAGMENTTCTIFSNQYVIDSTAFVDKNYVNVNAHELAHQWFGNMVTEQSGAHHWLHEGFATYYAYLAEEVLFGSDHMYWKLYETAKTLHNLSENGDGEALTNPNANSLTFYEKGAWALFLLRDRVGDMAFKKGIQNYLNKYAFGNVTIDDFLNEMELTSNQKLQSFRSRWLEDEEFPWPDVQKYLIEKNASLKSYFTIYQSGGTYPDLVDTVIRNWDALASDQLKKQLIKDCSQSLLRKDFIEKLTNESVKVRQAFVMATRTIPEDLRNYFEEFLDDPSYLTKEIAFVKLSLAFPERRLRYLRDLENLDGLPNKNIRLVWLTVALLTDEIPQKGKGQFYKELNAYTNSNFSFETRQMAFEYLSQINALSDSSILNLIDATNHHIWQFKKSSRNLLRSLAKEEKDRVERILNGLPSQEQLRLKKIITP